MLSVFKPILRMLLAAAIALSALLSAGRGRTDDGQDRRPRRQQHRGLGPRPPEQPIRCGCRRCCGPRASTPRSPTQASPATPRAACWRGWTALCRPAPSLVILQPGTNDERMGLGAERAGEYRENARRLDARGTKLIVIENSVLDALPRSELRDDGIHFTPAGYAILAERILPEVLAALGK